MPKAAPGELETSFAEVIELIQRGRQQAFQAANAALVDVYWRVGEYISRKLESAAWGDGVVEQLARYIARRRPELRGFTGRSLFRMRQFYEAYRGDPIVSALLTQLPWTHNLLVLGRCKSSQEREFYLRTALGQRWTSRELDRQISSGLFQRAMLSPAFVSPAVRQLQTAASS